MAGAFAKRVCMYSLPFPCHFVLMAISKRFPAPRQLQGPRDVRFSVIDEISRQASEAWGIGRAEVAFDYMKVTIPLPTAFITGVGGGEGMAQGGANYGENGDEQGGFHPRGMDNKWRDSGGNRRGRGMGRGRGRGGGGEHGRYHRKRKIDEV
ncbi:hypothetical protein ID866_4149 [Astraeus odoratus]|nr:hypothetical protein ID866_4149 [Astraeus odoratus]